MKKRIWLPPIDVCCEHGEVTFIIDQHQGISVQIICKIHKHKLISSPFLTSKHEIKIQFNKHLRKKIGIPYIPTK